MRGGYGNHWDDPSSISALTADKAFRRRRRKQQARHAAINGSLPPFDEAFNDLLDTFDFLACKGGQAPGLDRLTYRAVSKREIAHLLRAISKLVRAGEYRPQPTRPVSIPKHSGGYRVLQLASILDRVVARRLYELLTPLYERIFLENSYGFRPGRNTWLALAALEAAMRALGARVLIEDDIEKAFDNVNVDAARDDFARVISDPPYLALIGAILRGSAGANRKEGIGIDQGCPLSPLALNVHLHYAHDVHMGDGGNLPFWERYVDNLLYLTREVSEGLRARERAADLLKQVGLTLKGPGQPIDLREGRSAKLLGLELRLHKGTVRYSIPAEAYKELEIHLEEAHVAVDPPETARKVADGWINSYGPAFENSADDVVARVLDLADCHGFRGILRGEDIRSRWKSAHWSWLALRGKVLREAGL